VKDKPSGCIIEDGGSNSIWRMFGYICLHFPMKRGRETDLTIGLASIKGGLPTSNIEFS